MMLPVKKIQATTSRNALRRVLKKKLDVDVEYFYQEQGLGKDGACAAQGLSAQVDNYLDPVEEASE